MTLGVIDTVLVIVCVLLMTLLYRGGYGRGFRLGRRRALVEEPVAGPGVVVTPDVVPPQSVLLTGPPTMHLLLAPGLWRARTEGDTIVLSGESSAPLSPRDLESPQRAHQFESHGSSVTSTAAATAGSHGSHDSLSDTAEEISALFDAAERVGWFFAFLFCLTHSF